VRPLFAFRFLVGVISVTVEQERRGTGVEESPVMDEKRSRGLLRALGSRPVPVLLRLGWRADRGGTLALTLSSVFDAAAGVAGMLAVGALLNSIASTQGVAGSMPWMTLGIVGAIFLIQRVAFPFLGPAVESLEHRLTLLVRERVMEPLLRPATISHLEDPRVADELRLATQVGSENFSAQQALGSLNELASTRLGAIGAAALLGTWRWWAPLALGAAWLCSRAWYRRQMATLVTSMERNTPALRQAEYVGDLLLGGTAAKEARIFGAVPFLVGRFQARWLDGMTEVWRLRRGGYLATLLSAVVLFAAHFAIFGVLVRAALAGDLVVGDLFVFIQASLALAGFGFDPENEYVLRMGAAPLPHVLAVDRLVRAAEAQEPRGIRPPGVAPRVGIRLEGVSFSYPRTDRPVLDGVDLDIPAGRSLAIVGENGAGKSTLVNLLCGFYRPTGGRITVDGVDLAEIDPAAWQRRIAATFQDFARYPVTVRENVTFGNPAHANDYEARARAAERAGLLPVVEKLPKAWYSLLSREFEGGTELSGGQWQRVALARAMFALECGAGVLVLDEPTANLDVRAEAALYDRFLELTAGLTTIVVSHRFSTVRRADRIIVLENGRVAEAGGHDELIALGGRYARMFRLQARYYQDGGSEPAAVRNGRRPAPRSSTGKRSA
ncbi:MAG TPA: ABC transporter ATP-binding protein, partial [Acidimicrobiia bacterium]|nr:ABC transporter ATP-binding protein [Acidimicrobiia bacterium]